MSKITYEHHSGQRTVVTINPVLTTQDPLGPAALQEVWKVLEAEIQADADHITSIKEAQDA